MSDSSSGQVFDLDTHKTDLSESRITKNQLQHKNRLSLNADYISSPLATSAAKKSYTRANSTTFEEYQHGKTRTASFKQHSRVHSWSESSYRSAPSFSSTGDSNMTSLLVGVHSQYHPYNSEIPPHEKPYVKSKTKINTNKRFNRIVLAQTLAVDTTEVYATTTGIRVEDIGTQDPKQPMGAIWASRFSKDGRYMATAGQTCVVNVWKVLRDLERNEDIDVQDLQPHEPSIKVFHDAPVRTYVGHTADVLDISWSNNNFLISSSMDRTVRLWHISQKACLCVFRHLDIVTSAKFHPKDDRFFLSGSFDCKVRLWSISEKRVAFWNEIPAGSMVTAVGFTLDGRTACVGANTGDIFFFETQGLKYNTQILVKNHHHKHGKKVTGIEPMPGMPLGEERILVTTNDSRVWIINMKDKSFVYKYKGIDNPTLQLRASFSDDGRYIICGSEDGCVYLWCTDQVNYSPFQYWQESRIKAAVALGHLGNQILQTAMQYNDNYSDEHHGGVVGWLKRMIDKLRSRNEHFSAHQHIVTSAIFAPSKTRQILAKAGGDIILDNTPVYTHREPHNDADSHGSNEASSERRTSPASSPLTNNINTTEQEQAMDDLRRLLMHEFEEATPEERDRFDYPDSQIIISADLHGAIKVWRMDSGFYQNEADQQELSGHDNSTIDVDDDSDDDTFSTPIPPHNKAGSTTTHESSDTKLDKKGRLLARLLARFK